MRRKSKKIAVRHLPDGWGNGEEQQHESKSCICPENNFRQLFCWAVSPARMVFIGGKNFHLKIIIY